METTLRKVANILAKAMLEVEHLAEVHGYEAEVRLKTSTYFCEEPYLALKEGFTSLFAIDVKED